MPASMLASQAPRCRVDRQPATGVFQTLSAGNIGQLGAPGTGCRRTRSRARLRPRGPATSRRPPRKPTGPAVLRRRTNAPSLPQRPYPTAGRLDGRRSKATTDGQLPMTTSRWPVDAGARREPTSAGRRGHASGNAAGSRRMRRGKVEVNRPSPQGRSGSLANGLAQHADDQGRHEIDRRPRRWPRGRAGRQPPRRPARRRCSSTISTLGANASAEGWKLGTGRQNSSSATARLASTSARSPRGRRSARGARARPPPCPGAARRGCRSDLARRGRRRSPSATGSTCTATAAARRGGGPPRPG